MNSISCFILLVVIAVYCDAVEFPHEKRGILPSTISCGVPNCEGFPGFVSISIESKSGDCAGGLIGKRYVISNKPCLQQVLDGIADPHSITIQLGCEGKTSQNISVETVITDDSWNVALLRLQADVNFGSGIQPLCLPFEDFKRADVGVNVFTAGPLFHEFNIFQYYIRDNQICRESNVILDVNDENLMCLEKAPGIKRPSCYHDEGSPIINGVKNHLIVEGVLTHTSEMSGRSCDMERPVRGFRITEDVLQWIVDKVEA